MVTCGAEYEIDALGTRFAVRLHEPEPGACSPWTLEPLARGKHFRHRNFPLAVGTFDHSHQEIPSRR